MPEHASDKPVEKIKDAAQQAAKVGTSAPTARWHRTVFFRVALFSAIGAFAMLTFLVETTPSFPIDLQITLAIQSIDSPFFEGLMRLISWPGFLPQSIIITLLLAFMLYMYGLHWESVTSLLTAILSGVTNELVKNIIQRPRPTVDVVEVFAVLKSYSFPSGHVMFYTSLFGFIWYLAYTLLKRSWKRCLLLGFFGGFILLVGVSRIYLGQHWASDVLGAYLLGGLILVGIILFHQWGKKRFFLRQPAAPHDSTARFNED
ncbi:MAG: phosphatase PAP2 family protein [Anaerolineales bacterium]